MKRLYLLFAALAVLVGVVLVYIFLNYSGVKNNKEQNAVPHWKRTLTAEEIISLLGVAHIPASQEWSLYKNDKFHFSVNIPANMEVWHTADAWEQEGKDSIHYSVYLVDVTGKERGFIIGIKETTINSLEEYMAQDGGYSSLVIEKKNIGGVEAVSTSIPQNNTLPASTQSEEFRERHLLFVKDGFSFDVFTRDFSLEDTNRIWKSFRFLPN